MRPTAWLTMLSLSACAVAPTPPVEPPPIGPLPTLSPSQSARVEPALAIDRWWALFDDAELTALMDEALSRNHDLALAAARLREARARLDEVRASTVPSLGLQAQTARQRQSGDGALLPGADLTHSHHAVSLTGQYEVELWGRLASGNEAAWHRLQAQAWARAAVEWSLTAQVAETHFSQRAVQRQIEIAEAVRGSRAQALELRQRELRAGAASEFDMRRAEAEVAAADSTLVALRRQQATLDAALALLRGRPLGEITAQEPRPNALDTSRLTQARLPQGDAAQLLLRRPDLLQAEAQLAAARADVSAARAATLPALRLSGSVGSDVQSLSKLFNGPGFVWSIAAGLTQPLIDGGANRARMEQAQAGRDAALAQYRKTVLAAVLDLRQAYASLDLTDQARQAASQRVAALERSRRLAQLGVEAGGLARIDLLDAERNSFQAQLDEVTACRDRLLGQVAVMKALGGGHAGADTSRGNAGPPQVSSPPSGADDAKRRPGGALWAATAPLPP